jgi:DNA-binding MarR family transcriptional regulator
LQLYLTSDIISSINYMTVTPEHCANELLEVVPLMMRVIRSRVRSHSSPELSVAQFRALAFLGRNQNAMLGDVASFLALTLPAASKLIDGLVTAGFAGREIDLADRRKVALTLTAAGRRKYAAALKASADYLAERMSLLEAADRERIARAMKSLHAVFADEPSETRDQRPPPKRTDRAG